MLRPVKVLRARMADPYRSICLSLILVITAGAACAAESAWFDSDGTRLRYFSAGEGETVVLLHGFGGSATGLYIEPGTVDALVRAGFRVVALDQRGHGGSEKPYDADAYGQYMVEDVRRLLDHLGQARVHLVGYSMGGKVAASFHATYPDRLSSIALCGYGWPWQSAEVTLAEARAQLAERTVLPGNDHDALAAVSVGMPGLTPTEASLRANRLPAVAIIGDRDEVVPAEDLDMLSKTMAGIDVVVIPGTHAGPDGAPYSERFAEELVHFLKRL
ncbi:MAG: alpha/beta fold hydrolase [Gammaproteobacteria bacterium]|nr:alpha/beta fold hydrolase [Gammaproteobacteria bacterium]MDH5345123.1 alpha/beta fold hydrolase [Gammaproteobacteria bacterium]